MMIPMETVLKIIKTERKQKSKFTISDDMLMSAYDKIKWMVSVLPSPVSDEAFIENTEHLALIWIKQEIEKETEEVNLNSHVMKMRPFVYKQNK